MMGVPRCLKIWDCGTTLLAALAVAPVPLTKNQKPRYIHCNAFDFSPYNTKYIFPCLRITMINTFSYRASPHACSSVGHQPPGYFRPPCRSHLSTVAVETTTSSRYAIPEKDIHRHYFASVIKVSETTIGKSPGVVCRARRRSNYDDDNDSDDDEDDIDGDFHDYNEDDNDSGLSLDDLVGLDADAETSKELKEKCGFFTLL